MSKYYHKSGYISGYKSHTWARIPFHWRGASIYQRLYNVGDGAPFWVAYSVLSLAATITSACLIQFSLWWIYATVFFPVAWAFMVLQGMWLNDQPINGVDRARALEIDKYKELPRKIRRELKKSAKQIDKIAPSEEDISRSWTGSADWRRIVSGYHEMYPSVQKPKSDPLASAKAKFDERLTVIEEERKVLQEQKDLQAEIHAEVRDRVKKQMEAEGKVYVELNV